MKTINVRITDEQAAKIESSGLTISEFTRRAFDAFDVDYHEQILREILSYCSNKLECKEDVKINKESVKICKDEASENANCKDNLYTNTDNLYKDKDNLYTNKEKDEEKHTEIPLPEVAKILATDFAMLSNVLNNPENNNSVPDVTLNMLKKKHNLSKKTIENFVYRYKDQLKNGDFQ